MFLKGGRGFPSSRGGAGAGRGGAGGGRGGARKRHASSEGGAPARKAKKCGLCGVEGGSGETRVELLVEIDITLSLL